MFRKELEARLHKIFGMKKSTFNAPSDAFEQDTLFIEIGNATNRVSQGKVYSRVTGQVVVFSQENKLTYGFFNKRIEQAGNALTKDLFFFDIDTNVESSPARLQNITERRTSFMFLYSAQYDPNQGHITSLNLNIQEGE